MKDYKIQIGIMQALNLNWHDEEQGMAFCLVEAQSALRSRINKEAPRLQAPNH